MVEKKLYITVSNVTVKAPDMALLLILRGNYQDKIENVL